MKETIRIIGIILKLLLDFTIKVLAIIIISSLYAVIPYVLVGLATGTWGWNEIGIYYRGFILILPFIVGTLLITDELASLREKN